MAFAFFFTRSLAYIITELLLSLSLFELEEDIVLSFSEGEIFGTCLALLTYIPRLDLIIMLGLKGSALRGRYCNVLLYYATVL